MTTGSKLMNQSTQVMPDGNTLLIGTYFYKYWSGGNQIGQPPRFTNVYSKRLGWHRRYVKPPTRSLKYDDHVYVMTRTKEYVNPFTWRWRSDPPERPVRYGTQLSLFGGVVAPRRWGSGEEIALLGKLREKVVGSDFNAGIFLGEGKQSLAMIADSATRILAGARAFRRGDVTQGLKHLGARPRRGTRNVKTPTYTQASNLWLEYSYGWSPLIDDCYGGAIALAHNFSVPLKFTVRAKLQQVGRITASSPPNVIVGHGENLNRGYIIARLTERDVVGLLGLQNPSSVAWELLPWSFVVDWFIPVGNYLAARGLSQALKGSFTKTIVQKVIAENLVITNKDFQLLSSNDYSYEYTSVQRDTYSSLEVPTPSIKPLGEVPSWKRTANALSLLGQRFPRS